MGVGWEKYWQNIFVCSRRILDGFHLASVLRDSFFCAIRACLKIPRGTAARDFGRGPGGEVGASRLRAVTTGLTPPVAKIPAVWRFSPPRIIWFCYPITIS